MSELFFVSALLCVAWGIVSSIKIVSFLSDRGVKINYFLMKVMIFRYITDYHRITKEEKGVSGPWFYSYIISMNLAAVLAIAGILTR